MPWSVLGKVGCTRYRSIVLARGIARSGTRCRSLSHALSLALAHAIARSLSLWLAGSLALSLSLSLSLSRSSARGQGQGAPHLSRAFLALTMKRGSPKACRASRAWKKWAEGVRVASSIDTPGCTRATEELMAARERGVERATHHSNVFVEWVGQLGRWHASVQHTGVPAFF